MADVARAQESWKAIRAMDIKEFAAKVRMASPNVLRAISPRRNPTQDTLNRLLKTFKLRLSLAPLPGKTDRTPRKQTEAEQYLTESTGPQSAL